MKKLLVFVVAFATVQQVSSSEGASAPVAPAASTVPVASASVAPATKTEMLKKIAQVPVKVVSSFVSSVESKISANPKMAALVIVAMTLVAEQIAVYAYNSFAESDDNDDEDLDIA